LKTIYKFIIAAVTTGLQLVRCAVSMRKSAYMILYTQSLILLQRITLKKMFDPSVKILLPAVQKQNGVKDCGLFALAFATFLAFRKSHQPLLLHHFDLKKLRLHLISCLEEGVVSEFPSN